MKKKPLINSKMQSSKLPINLVPLLPCMFLLKSLLNLPLAVAMMMILFFEIDPQFC
ncbi:ATP-dependent dethiobiotin synthetase BioD [Bienertia sinuspersici]